MKRILVIDDDSSTREVLELALGLAGFEVITNAGMENVFVLLDELKPDILIIDYMLTESNGGDICRQIKENDQTVDLPVILFSACMGIEDPLNKYKCDLFVEKPFDLSYMTEQINSLISREHVVAKG